MSATTTPRRGATRAADIPADVLQALSAGTLQTATLAECLAVDQSQLIRTVFPDLSDAVLQQIDAACALGILKRMSAVGAVLLDVLGTPGIAYCQTHASDTVRGWACFMVGAQRNLDLGARLVAIRPLADDGHFGVREWSWMAVRPLLVETLEDTVLQLSAWTTESSERLRRFACEVLRPRGVWASHITKLKRDPVLALPVLMALRADPSVYVQDSVANWLNDAAKDQPDWVRALCAEWLVQSPCDATRRICQRALRSLK